MRSLLESYLRILCRKHDREFREAEDEEVDAGEEAQPGEAKRAN